MQAIYDCCWHTHLQPARSLLHFCCRVPVRTNCLNVIYTYTHTSTHLQLTRVVLQRAHRALRAVSTAPQNRCVLYAGAPRYVRPPLPRITAPSRHLSPPLPFISTDTLSFSDTHINILFIRDTRTCMHTHTHTRTTDSCPLTLSITATSMCQYIHILFLFRFSDTHTYTSLSATCRHLSPHLHVSAHTHSLSLTRTRTHTHTQTRT